MTNHRTCIFSMSTHLAAYSVSQPENWSGPNLMPYPDVLSNYTYTYTELDCFRLRFLMISAIIWMVYLPPTTPRSITSLSVSHLPLVQTAERCRMFVIVQDRDKLNPKYGGSWYQPARKKNGVITQTFLSVFQSGRSHEDVGGRGSTALLIIWLLR
jgi:hypothetical protein